MKTYKYPILWNEILLTRTGEAASPRNESGNIIREKTGHYI